MSLERLRSLRREGSRPSTVLVILGKPPGWVYDWFAEDADCIVIDRELRDVDLSALVGLPVNVIDLNGDAQACQRLLEALQEAGALSLGLSVAAGVVGVSPEHEAALRRYREVLCL